MKGPIARGTIRTSFVLGLRLFVQAGTLLIVARMLGPDRFGAFAGVAALALILGTLATFGTHLTLLGEVAKAPNRRLDVLEYAVPTTLACATLLFLAYLTLVMLGLPGADMALPVIAAIGIAEMLLQPLLTLVVHEHLGLGRIARSQLLQILPLALRLIAAATVWLAHPEDPLKMYAWGYLVASLIALAVARLTMPGPGPRPSSWRFMRWAEVREAAGYAALNVTRIGPTELDKTLALRLLPMTSTGVYAAATRVMGAIILPITAMTLSSLPRLFREGRDQPQRTSRLLRWMFGATTLYITGSTAILWLCAPLFNRIFGDAYHGLDIMLRWLCIALPGMGIRLTAGNILMALGKPWMRAGFEVVGLLVMLIASITLTVHLGTPGMLIALVCSEWSMALVGVGLIIRVQSTRSSLSRE